MGIITDMALAANANGPLSLKSVRSSDSVGTIAD